MLVPYRAGVPMSRWPIANWIALGLIVLMFPLSTFMSERQALSLVLTGWRPAGLLGYMWLHAGMFHALGNMVFLWVFGNAVCAELGNWAYLPVYVALGVAAGGLHLLFSGAPVVGASGAINGIVGMFLVLYPINEITCFYWFGFWWGTFSISSYWLILLWFAFDILGAATGAQGVAYVAHIGGFLAGAGLAVLALKAGWMRMDQGERSLLDVLREAPAEAGSRRSPRR
jgi:membrane associated rhomboid family serine protease